MLEMWFILFLAADFDIACKEISKKDPIIMRHEVYHDLHFIPNRTGMHFPKH